MMIIPIFESIGMMRFPIFESIGMMIIPILMGKCQKWWVYGKMNVNWDDDYSNINGKMPKMATKPPTRPNSRQSHQQSRVTLWKTTRKEAATWPSKLSGRALRAPTKELSRWRCQSAWCPSCGWIPAPDRKTSSPQMIQAPSDSNIRGYSHRKTTPESLVAENFGKSQIVTIIIGASLGIRKHPRRWASRFQSSRFTPFNSLFTTWRKRAKKIQIQISDARSFSAIARKASGPYSASLASGEPQTVLTCQHGRSWINEYWRKMA